MTTRQKRHRLLLDEMLPRRNKFPQINDYHNVRHIVHDLRKGGGETTQEKAKANEWSVSMILKQSTEKGNLLLII